MEPSHSWDDISVSKCMTGPGSAKSKPRESLCVSYQKLVVPVKMRSVYWKGFGFPANEKGEILTKQKIVCLFCQTSIAYNRNTSNLRMHLESKHRSKLEEFEANAIRSKRGQRQSEKRSEESVFEMDTVEHIYTSEIGSPLPAKVKKPNRTVMQPHSSLVEITVPNLSDKEDDDDDDDEETNSIENAVTEFLVTDLVSPCVVQGSGFKRLLSVLRPGTTEISKAKVEEQLLTQCHTALRDAIIEELSVLQAFGISLEEWKSGNENVFLSISVHILKQDGESIESRVLTSLLLPIQSASWSSTILNALHKWGISNDNIGIVVIASSHYELLSSRLKACGLKVVPCLTYTLQQAVDKCYQIDQISAIISKCLSLERSLPDDCEHGNEVFTIPGFWMSSYNLLQKIHHKKSFLKTAEEQHLTVEEWELIECVVNILNPFTVIIDTLIEEKVASVTLVKPFLCQMINCHLKDLSSDGNVTAILKLILRSELSSFFLVEETDLYLTIASYLDPRFKSLEMNQGMNYSLILDNIKSMLESSCEDSSKPLENKARLSGMGMLFGDICKSKSSTLSKGERMQIELSQYQSEHSATFDMCPIMWWSATRAKCPNLAKLALKFLCVPASSVPPNLLSMANRANFHMHRAAINSEATDKLIFLNANKKLFSFQDS